MDRRPTRTQQRQAARAEQAALRAKQARRRRRLRIGLPVTGLALVVIVGLLVLATRPHKGAATQPSNQSQLPGLQTGPAPWNANTTDLAARLRAIGLPPLGQMEGTDLHLHQHLDLYVDGQPVQLPALVGIAVHPDGSADFAPLHVHDTSGIIHVESPIVRTYTLGQFFAVWGVRLTPTCIGGYCTAGGKELRVYVNGARYQADPTTLPLAAHQEILIAYGTPAELPNPIPTSYHFPAGE